MKVDDCIDAGLLTDKMSMTLVGNVHINNFHTWIMYGLCAQDIIPGPRLNIKTVLSTYGDFHVKDKTAVRTSFL